VHSFGSKHRATEHPDSRAKLYDLDKFNKKKISKLADLVNGMKKLSQFARSVGTECGLPSSRLLAPLLTIDVDNADDTAAAAAPAGSRGAAGSPLRLFPDLAAHLKFFESSVNLSQAQRTGNIEPRLGMNAEYDRAAQDIDDIKGRLEDELRAERTGQLKGSGVKWFHHKSKVEDMYQLEIEETWLAKHTPPPGMYISKSKTKKARRFQTKAIVACLKELEAAEKRRADSRVDTMRAVFARFADAGDLWARAVRCVSTVDALCALAAVSNQHGYTRPAIVEEAGATSKKTAEAAAGGGAAPVVLDLQQVRHPCLVLPVGQEAIPNDTKLGGEEGHSGSTPRMLLLTGPNMGGKSTLLRCCCVVSIMAQLGCFVPGNEVRLSPIDRIFTRLGASDRILAGQSTFFVELSEAAAILHHATSRYAFVTVLYLPSTLSLPHYSRTHTLLIISHRTLRFDIFVPHPGPWSFSTNLDEAHPRSTARR
jgi:DNA mismatch repair protein MSH6